MESEPNPAMQFLVTVVCNQVTRVLGRALPVTEKATSTKVVKLYLTRPRSNGSRYCPLSSLSHHRRLVMVTVMIMACCVSCHPYPCSTSFVTNCLSFVTLAPSFSFNSATLFKKEDMLCRAVTTVMAGCPPVTAVVLKEVGKCATRRIMSHLPAYVKTSRGMGGGCAVIEVVQ